jgi:FixJ family two-component response regulator
LPEKTSLISIVDDDESVRETTKGLMRSLGYVADAFASGEEFLESGHVYDYSCLISDIQMPGMNGIELQNRLIAQGYRLPIIFITADPELKLRTRALDAGALAFLSKPFSEDSLIKHLDEALLNRC